MSDTLIPDFNAADTWQKALAAIKDTAYFEILFEDAETRAEYSQKLTDLPDDQGREQAIGSGVNEVRSLFGDFETIEEIRAAVTLHIDTEHAKHVFINALDAATTAEGMAAAIKSTVALVNEHRQDLIEKWDGFEGNDALDARVAALKADPYTKAFAEIASHMNDAAYMAELGARVLAARDALAGGKFFGVVKISDAFLAADAAMDAELVEAINDATTDAEVLAAIKAIPSLLLDADALGKLTDLPDGGGREKAIGLGILEIKTLFGDYANVAAVKTAVELHIDTEHAKFKFISALDGATSATEMAAAIKANIGLVNTHRQDLIEDWAGSGVEAAEARAAVLADADFTKVLAEIVTHLDDDAYMAELGARMLTARNALEGGQFFGDSKIITALKAADLAINIDPTAPGAKTITINEDTSAATADIDAADLDSDTLTYSVKDTAMPQKGTVTFDQANGTFTYVPDADVNGTDTFTIVISDGKGGTTEQVVNVTIRPVNDAPVAASTGNSASGDEDTVINGDLPFSTDVDAGDLLEYELVAPVAGLTLNADGSFRYAPPADFNGVVEFEYRVVDSAGAKSEAQTFKLTVNAVNDAPRDITLSNAAVLENTVAGTEVGKLTASDPEGGVFTYTLLDNAGGRFAVDAATGLLTVASTFALDYEQATSHTIRVQVKDSAGAAYEETLTIKVGDVSGEKVTGTSTSDVLTGDRGNDVLKAGAGSDTVSGGSGNDTLYGGSGNDKVRGGIGKDTLKGEAGKDTFVFDTKAGKSNVDKILDFKVKDDSFWLDNAVFTKLGKKGTEANPAKLNKSFFTIGDKAKDKNDYVIYDNKKGKLFYDADGSGKGKQVEIATLSKNLKITEKDFFIV